MSRIQNSIRNSMYGVMSQVIIVLISFVTRKIFTVYLGADYLGLNGLFSNVISILSLTELGFGTAALYSLYKPAEKDERKISALMNLYERIYHIMFAVVLALGLILMPFIPYFIKDMPDIKGLYFIYFLFVLNSAISYLFAYKRSLLFADQKNYKITQKTTLFKVILAVSQSLILIVTGNYFLYLIALIIVGFLENLSIARIVDREYPFLKEFRKEKVDKNTKHELMVNTRALMMHKIGTIAVFQTDNLIMSAFINLATVGIYSNYTMITNQLHTFILSITDGLKASIGSYNASETRENRLLFFYKLNFLFHIIYSFCTVTLFCLINPFILMIFGEKYIFTMDVVLLIVAYFYLRGMRGSYTMIKEVSGIFDPDKYKALLEAVVNVVTSIYLAKVMGIAGVLLGTIITTLTIPYIIEVHVTFKYAFAMNSWAYYKVFLKNLAVTSIAMALTYFICTVLPGNIFVNFILRGLVCVVVPNLINVAFYYKTSEFRYFKQLAANILMKVMKR